MTRRLLAVPAGPLFVRLDRGDYWQCAYVIPKGGFDELRRKGLSAFRSSIVEINPEFANRVQELASLDHLRHWSRPGLLCIGDEAHAMSPVASI